MISYEVSGIGFPLACDFLKELGFSEYGKPDVHLKDIFKALDLIDPNEKSASKLDYQTLKVIDRIAKENGTTAYAVDKIFWLIGSGSFYLSNLKIGRQKKVFIEKVKNTNKTIP
jgi:thermostable 8-oxoguanine DNA glycosylase